MKSDNYNLLYELEKLSQKDIVKWNKRSKELKNYFIEHYDYFAKERSLIFNELKAALIGNCFPFEFEYWQRLISYKYSLDPLSALGSMRNAVGGRFNIGRINPMLYPSFGAIYIAEDRDTAFREKHGIPKKGVVSGLTERDFALTKKTSETIISLSGNVKAVLDITTPSNLKDFFSHIRGIKLPKHFIKQAEKLHIEPLAEVKSLKSLHRTLHHSDWRLNANLLNIPANSQAFGHIAHEAGVEGILYLSSKDEKACLTIYPENFKNSPSYLEIDPKNVPEKMPPEKLRLDKHTYSNFI